ncbi:MAG: DUF2190 family protein [Phycisphaerae bacterium]|nr:DUF2190 family protein [Phycisphaerae bacterium]
MTFVVQSNEAPFDTGDSEAGATITRRRFVTIDDAVPHIVQPVSGASDVPIGILSEDASSGQTVTVAHTGILYVDAGAAFAAGAWLTIDSSGRVVEVSGPASQTNIIGRALEAASGDGDRVLCLVTPGVAFGAGTLAVGATEAFTGDDTLTAAESGKLCTNLGAGGTVTLTLPAAAAARTTFLFLCKAGFAFRVKPNTNDAFRFNGALRTDNKYLELGRIGDALLIVADAAGNWDVLAFEGRLSLESTGKVARPDFTPDVAAFTEGSSPVTVSNYVSGTRFTNRGAGGTVEFDLPSAASAGTKYAFYAQAAFALRIDPGASDGIYINGALQTDGFYVEFDAVGEYLELEADDQGNWMATNFNGTFTVET